MRKYVSLIAVLIIALMVVGCGKKPETAVTTAPGQETAEKAKVAGEGANTLGDLMKKQKGLSSYIMVMDAGPMKTKSAVKLENGKPVAMKVNTGEGWILIRLDKKMQYIYNPATKSVMAMPTKGDMTGGPESVPDTAALEALKDSKTSTDTVDGVECLKVTKADGSQEFWMEKENGLPVQVKMGEQTMKFKYEQINSVPDSEFELPAGTKIQAMPAMPKMPKMPQMPG